MTNYMTYEWRVTKRPCILVCAQPCVCHESFADDCAGKEDLPIRRY